MSEEKFVDKTGVERVIQLIKNNLVLKDDKHKFTGWKIDNTPGSQQGGYTYPGDVDDVIKYDQFSKNNTIFKRSLNTPKDLYRICIHTYRGNMKNSQNFGQKRKLFLNQRG